MATPHELSMTDFLNGCQQFRTTLTHASGAEARRWDPDSLKNALGWADYVETVCPASTHRPSPPPTLRPTPRVSLSCAGT